MVFEQELHPIVRRGNDLFVAGQRQHDVAIRDVFLGAIAHQIGNESGGHGLVVGGATRIKMAVLLDEFERIALPIFALGLHHVDVREQQQRLFRAIAAQAHDQISLFCAARRRQQMYIRRDNAR